ncbi:hypothetical protein HYN48_14090 [Flavobacterium magnum]|uniref:Lipoprotein n=2 Tax=Flavobacterium magnum TaxID=2162713 RepID=A0A2S0RIN1_9FLAO|nr:hypothetical protein HYN48_13815 [Flavobacterium magnum]AWA31130.1 hypothetical protein HYN48_14090 [Flavobacterium magnum]
MRDVPKINFQKMKRRVFFVVSLFIVSLFIVASCTEKKVDLGIIRKTHKPSPNLISFDLKYNLSKEDRTNRNFTKLSSRKFDLEIDTIKYTRDEIYISYLSTMTGCIEYAGDFDIKGDSLNLKLIQLNNVVCPEVEVARVIYKIRNPKNIQYKISKPEFGKYGEPNQK